jgi:hypothetical protein
MNELGARLADWHATAPLVMYHPYGLIHRRVGGAQVWNGWLALRELTLAPDSSPE